MSEGKSAKAYRTISEVAESLGVPQHVLRFWETKFPAVKPLKRGGNRRYYRPEDIELLQVIHRLLHVEGYTIKGAQKLLKEQGARPLVEALMGSEGPVPLALAAVATDGAADDNVSAQAAPRAEPEAQGEAVAEADRDADAESAPADVASAASAAGETPAVDAAVLSAELAQASAPAFAGPASDDNAGTAPEDIAAAVAVMPVEMAEATLERAVESAAPKRSAEFAEAAPAARQRSGALVAELKAIRAQLAEALAATTPAAR